MICAVIIVIFFIVIRSIYFHYSQQLGEVKKQQAELEKGVQTLEEWSALQGSYKETSSHFLSQDVLSFKRFVEDNADR